MNGEPEKIDARILVNGQGQGTGQSETGFKRQRSHYKPADMLDLVQSFGQSSFFSEPRDEREASHRGHRGRKGIRPVDESSVLNASASCARTTQKGESIAQRSQRSQRGIGPVDESSVVNASASGARTMQKRKKHRTEVTEKRGIGPVDESSVVNASASGARTTQKKKHRPEITEATEGGLGQWIKAPW